MGYVAEVLRVRQERGMAWIESHQSLLTHRKTLRAVARLKCNKYLLIGHLHALWWWSLDNATIDGELFGVEAEEISDAAGWPTKRADEFVEALLDARFLERITDGYKLHDWYDYAGKLNAKRAANKERMRDARAGNVQRTDDARAEHVQGLPTSPPQPTNKHNQQTEPTGTALTTKMPFTSEQILQLQREHPAVNTNSRWREFVEWVNEEEEKRRPKDLYFAFEGWLRKKEPAPRSVMESFAR